jgi:hypothetical protein
MIGYVTLGANDMPRADLHGKAQLLLRAARLTRNRNLERDR